MSKPSAIASEPITNDSQLAQWYEAGCTPENQLAMGIEAERPAINADGSPARHYAGPNGSEGIVNVMRDLGDQPGWSRIYEGATQDDRKLFQADGLEGDTTLEPGEQIEIGTSVSKNVHETVRKANKLYDLTSELAAQHGIHVLPVGFNPLYMGQSLPLVEKSRYQTLIPGLINMYPKEDVLSIVSCTATAQMNFGFTSEADMVKKLRVALSIQPVAVALFASSPFLEGAPSDYQSVRSATIRNAFNDGSRARYGGMLPEAFEDGYGFESQAKFMRDEMPMLGYYQGDIFKPADGARFTDFETLTGRAPTLSDFANHVNTYWPEVRPRRTLETRGTDTGPKEMLSALCAFWTGLMYDKTSLDDTARMVQSWTQQDREYLREHTPRTGLQTPFKSGTVQDIARELVLASKIGLQRRNVQDNQGNDESVHLQVLEKICEDGRNFAMHMVDAFEGPWNRDIRNVFKAMAYPNEPSLLQERTFQPVRNTQVHTMS